MPSYFTGRFFNLQQLNEIWSKCTKSDRKMYLNDKRYKVESNITPMSGLLHNLLLKKGNQ